MALTAPTQLRSLDPYSDNRFSNVINRMTRIVTNGKDVILFPQYSFPVTRTSATTLTVGPGLCIKDDTLIQITSDYVIDISSNDYYEDASGGADSVGTYYLVMRYIYNRTLPVPKAYFKLIKDITNLYDLGTLSDSYLFIAAVKIVFNSSYEISTASDNILFYDDATATELITNGDMETGSPPSSWTGNNATLITESIIKHSGSQSLKVKKTGDNSVAYQNITTVVGTKYKVTGWVYAPAGGAADTFGINVGTTIGSSLLGGDLVKGVVDTWVSLELFFTATTTTTLLQLSVESNNNDFALFDDISFIKSDETKKRNFVDSPFSCDLRTIDGGNL